MASVRCMERQTPTITMSLNGVATETFSLLPVNYPLLHQDQHPSNPAPADLENLKTSQINLTIKSCTQVNKRPTDHIAHPSSSS